MEQNDFPKNLAGTDYEAKQRFDRFVRDDPLPEVMPALLNSADIEEYVRLTGMVFPFNAKPDSGKLKSASYEVDFLGDLHVVDPAEGYKKAVICKDAPYRLRKNSISFLFLETTFRLPDYMAARFNLRITHVHAGLLLGTGPLIDPGFAGRLLIPLHNLTSEDYIIKGGDGLIWVEFTKLSENVRWKHSRKRVGEYRPFPEDKRYGTAEKYFEKAAGGRPGAVPESVVVGEVKLASSSIPGEIKAATESAGNAERDAMKARRDVNVLRNFGILGIAAILVAAATVTYNVYSLIQDANKNVGDAGKNISDYREYQNQQEKRIDALAAQVKALQDALRPRKSSAGDRTDSSSKNQDK